jgi:hypothetical protein
MWLNSWMKNLNSRLRVLLRKGDALRARRRNRVLAGAANGAEILEQRALMTAAAVSNLGVVRGQTWNLDTDPTTATHEIDLAFGLPGDKAVAGSWDGMGTKAGVVRQPGQNGAPKDGLLHWYLDLNGDPAAERQQKFGLPGDIPVVGDWDGNGTDNIGIVRLPGVNGAPRDGLLHWYLDINGDSTADIQRAYGLPGDLPVVGHWDQSAKSQIGVVRTLPTGFMNWLEDVNGDTLADRSFIFGYAPNGDIPVVGDWDQAGGDNAGVVRPSVAGQGNSLTWLLDTNNDSTPDLSRQFGLVGDTPIVGNWKLPEVNVVGITSGQSASGLDFGTIATGTSVDRTFTVQNLGTADLQIGQITLQSTAGPAMAFSMVNPTSGPIAPGQSRVFTVRANSTSAGTTTALIHIANNDGNELDYKFPLAARFYQPTPEVTVSYKQGSFNVPVQDGQITSVIFASALVGAPPVSMTFTVQNDGTGPLIVDQPRVPNGFVLSTPMSATTLAPNSSTTFTVQLVTTSAATWSGDIVLITNDADENPFNFPIAGRVSVPAPEIDIVGLTDGQSQVVDFGTTLVDSFGLQQTFTVLNTGTATLHFGSMTLPSQFIVHNDFPSSLEPNQATTFTVELRTNRTGTFSGTLSLANDDANENPFNFKIKGVVLPRIPQITVTGITDGQRVPVDFGTVQQGRPTLTKTFTVTNTGTATLTLGEISLPGGFSITEGLTRSLEPGASDSFTVTMSTNATGHFGGTIQFFTNDPQAPVFDFQIEGRVFEVSSRFGRVLDWKIAMADGYLAIVKQVLVTDGRTLLFGDFFDPNGGIRWKDRFVGNHGTTDGQGPAQIAVLSNGMFAIAWKNVSSHWPISGIRYVILDRAGDTFYSSERSANRIASASLTLTSITSNSNGGFTIRWRDGAGVSWKRDFSLTGSPLSDEKMQ